MNLRALRAHAFIGHGGWPGKPCLKPSKPMGKRHSLCTAICKCPSAALMFERSARLVGFRLVCRFHKTAEVCDQSKSTVFVGRHWVRSEEKCRRPNWAEDFNSHAPNGSMPLATVKQSGWTRTAFRARLVPKRQSCASQYMIERQFYMFSRFQENMNGSSHPKQTG